MSRAQSLIEKAREHAIEIIENPDSPSGYSIVAMNRAYSKSTPGIPASYFQVCMWEMIVELRNTVLYLNKIIREQNRHIKRLNGKIKAQGYLIDEKKTKLAQRINRVAESDDV